MFIFIIRFFAKIIEKRKKEKVKKIIAKSTKSNSNGKKDIGNGEKGKDKKNKSTILNPDQLK
jgi:hypothetical protein